MGIAPRISPAALVRRIALMGCVVAGCLSLVGCRHHNFPTYPANYREYVYVANAGSNTVTAIDVVNLRVDREIAVGVHPVALLAATTRNELEVLNSGSAEPASRSADGSLAILNPETQRVTATLPAGRAPRSFTLSLRDHFAYVATADGLLVLDLEARRKVAEIPLRPAPDRIAVTPDGLSVLMTSITGNDLTILTADPSAMRWSVRAQIGGCPGAASMAVLPDSSKVFVACSLGHQIMAVALARQADPKLERPDTHPDARPDAREAMLEVGQLPTYLALKPDGGELFVSNSGSNSISEVVTSSDDVGGSYLIGSTPGFGLVSADNSLLYESSLQSQQIAVYSIDEGRRLGSISVGDGPDQMAFSADGHLLFAIDRRSGDLAAVRTDTRSLFTLLPTGRDPVAIADKSFMIH